MGQFMRFWDLLQMHKIILIETPFNPFANRADLDQAAPIRAA